VRHWNLQHRQGEDADVDSLSSSSDPSDNDDDDDAKQERPFGDIGPLRRVQSSRQQRQEEKKRHKYSRFRLGNDYFSTTGKVRKRDGRLNISVNEKDSSGYLAKALGTGFRHHFFHPEEKVEKMRMKAEVKTDEKTRRKTVEGQDEIPEDLDDFKDVPRLNIVIIVIGSRGDIQPFLRVGRLLHDEYGHRVRIATHPAFKDFVEKEGALEFFSVGGDPSELMAFMVKNPGLVPSLETIRAGDIGARRAQMSEMFEGMWRACINTTDDETNKSNSKMMDTADPFVADAIIANPPSFAHIHIAERLGIPLHLMFTFPYTPTTAFPHPLANIKSTNVDHAYANFMSYPLVELMTWQGLGDLINKFRIKTLGMEAVSTLWAPGQIYRMNVPFTYMWSPGLVPKPADYPPNIDICGFVFLELGSTWKPPEDLQKFLDAGEPPVYIGFGSIVVDDPNAFTKMIFEAVEMAGVRALVSKGWGGLGGGEIDIPDNIFLLDNTPHDWLFPRVSAVVHHGGAGTTAMGLKCARPTMIVPFFGDQPFWGAMVAKARAGAFECIPHKKLTTEKFAEGIKQCLTDDARKNVSEIAERIAAEGDGAHNAVKSFHKHLKLSGAQSIRCSILENRVAVWKVKVLGLKLSALAAQMLTEQNKLRWQDMRLVRHNEWNDFEGPGGPITGFLGPILGTAVDMGMGVASIPVNSMATVRQRKKHKAKKKRVEERRRKLAEVNGAQANSNANGNAHGRPKPDLNRMTTLSSIISADPQEPLVEELAKDTRHGLSKVGKGMLRFPLNLMVGITQGFHNAPRLYGDETVRRPARVSGFKSGLRAGRDEFLYGIWDGWTGVVTQPYHGAKEHGVIGGLEGTAVGIGGFFLKNLAAPFGLLTYPVKGVEREMVKGRQPTKFIRKARIVQGAKELRALRDAAEAAERAAETQDADTDRTKVEESDKEPCAEKEGNDIFCPRTGENLADVQRTIDSAWDIITELLTAVNKKRSEGPLKIKGRLVFWVNEKKWHDSGAMESVHSAKVALEAKKAGRDVKDAVEEWRKEQRRDSQDVGKEHV
jgi:UDP:flavonoid glycosyltransferase YjiC (YdhE family)